MINLKKILLIFSLTLFVVGGFVIFKTSAKQLSLTETPEDTLVVNGSIGIGVSPRAKLDVDGGALFSGDVGIGTSTPSTKLDVMGNINITGDSSYLYDGYNALKLATKGDPKNNYTSTIIGREAGDNITDGTTRTQTAVGYQAGHSNTGSSQTAVGMGAGAGNTGDSAVSVGSMAGYSNTGDHHTALGSSAGRYNTGIYQTAIGASASYQLSGVSGDYQTVVGAVSGYSNIGDHQTAVGYEAGRENEGNYQTALGSIAGYLNTGVYQTAVGYEAGRENQGNKQTAIGLWAGRLNSGINQTVVGYEAGYLNTGDNSTGLGYQAIRENIAHNVVAIGYQAAHSNNTTNQFILKQNNINTTPLIQGDFSTGNLTISGNVTADVPLSDSHLATKGYVDAAIPEVGVQWAGYSGSTTTGSMTGPDGSRGLHGMNTICDFNYSGSHACTYNEVLALGSDYPWTYNTWVIDGIDFNCDIASSNCWLFSKDGYSNRQVDPRVGIYCTGWTDDRDGYASVMMTSGNIYLGSCTKSYPVPCCY